MLHIWSKYSYVDEASSEKILPKREWLERFCSRDIWFFKKKKERKNPLFLKGRNCIDPAKPGSTTKSRVWEKERESFMDRGCRENRETSGWERSSYDVTPTFSWRYNSVSPFVLDSPLLFFSFSPLCLSRPSFSSLSPAFPVLHLIIECTLSSVLFPVRCSLRSAARDGSNTDFTTLLLTSI